MTPRTVKIDIGGTGFQKDIVKLAVDGWSREQVHTALRQTAIDITERQASLDNKPTFITVDNSSFKSIENAERKIVILFGTHLAQAVVLAVERAIIAAIDVTTDKITGQLANIGNWEWTFVPGQGSSRIVRPSDITTMAIDDRLILRPRLKYATAANQNVAGGRRGLSFKVAKKAKAKKIRANTSKGFFGAAAELLRRDSSINKSFSVYASFTRRFLAEGEVARAGKGGPLQTGQIVLRPKRRGRLV